MLASAPRFGLVGWFRMTISLQRNLNALEKFRAYLDHAGLGHRVFVRIGPNRNNLDDATQYLIVSPKNREDFQKKKLPS